MKDFEIFADSAANIPDELIRKHNINIIPLSYVLDGKETPCWEEETAFTETAKAFYAKMREGAEFKTSLIPVAAFVERIAPVMKAGKDAVLVTITAGLSGTYNQAVEAKKLLEDEYPENKLYVCDSANASMGEGLQVLQMATLREEGYGAEDCVAWHKDNAYKINSYVTINELKYLRRGGRVSMASAIAGTLLNIKPVLKADDGEIAKLVVYAKERGRKKSIAELLAMFDERADLSLCPTVAITHADCADEAEALAAEIKARGAKEVIIEYYDLCTGAHVGPGTIALFFFGKDRREERAPQKTTFIKKIFRKS